MQKLQGWAEQGNTTLSIGGASGVISRKVQGSFASATVTVYVAGTVTLATIYSDNTLTSKANPFTASADATWFFYAPNGGYDVKFSGGGITTPFTIGDLWLFDETEAWINVKSSPYFATGLGVADDTVAIQAALTAAGVRGSSVFIPEGTYLVSDFLRVPDGVDAFGANWNSIIKTNVELPFPSDWGGSASAVIFITPGSTGNVIRDLCVYGPYSGTGTSGTTFGISPGQNCSNIEIRNCKVMNASWSGIFMATGTSQILVEGCYTEHCAIAGIESYASQSIISNNRSFDDSAAAANGTASIEILPGSTDVGLTGNVSDTCNGIGIQIGAAASGITVANGQIYSPGGRGISDNGSTDLRIVGCMVDTPRGSGALGNGIMLSNVVRFTVANNTVKNANVGSGPSGYELAGTCNHGVFNGNVATGCWVGVVMSGVGASGTVLVCNNHSYGSISGADYANTGGGTLLKVFMNSWGTTAFTSSIPGTVDGSNATAGDVGEFISGTRAVGAAVSLTTSTTATAISIALTAGDWDISGSASFLFDTTTSYTILQAGISTIAATIGGRDSVVIFETTAVIPGTLTDPAFTTPTLRVSSSGSFTAYLVVQGTFTVSFLKAYGFIRARRVR